MAQNAETQSRGQRKEKIGIVSSNKMKKTIVVRIARRVRHGQYERVMKRSTSFKAHDEENTAGIGDLVKIVETRPISKDKRWRLVEVLQRASLAPPVPETEVDVTPQAKIKETPEEQA
ncbi:MAG: 30S ribosomal protein S17 [Candidatus Omnitrophica bacterium]|nr:30S ribosomal protein S17 [Candidatus Omnitrophota bacterium]MBI2174066.1 30S ribosomal protein S17 [Candidatus Omnitrophota bacterium]MBI3010665.1 30S ribosomal protein S17 [Candidatus Omnitrophota bacterium]